MMGPRCPACGAKVRLPKNTPLPPPHAKVKCPTCGSSGELEAFLSAAGTPDPEPMEEARRVDDTTRPSAPAPKVPEDPGEMGTRISGSATALNLPQGLRCALTVISGPDVGKKMPITKARIVVGRNGGDFPLTDGEVSTEHCAFEVSGVTCTVKDLGSSNGTWIDGAKIERHQLSSVGEVVVGGTTLLFTMTLEDQPQEG